MFMKSSVPPPADRVSSSTWINHLKAEIGEADSADPTIFEDAKEAFKNAVAASSTNNNDRSSSEESAISFLANAALIDARASSRGSSFASMMGLSLGTISLDTDQMFALGSPTTSTSTLSSQRKSTIDFLQKMGLLESTTSSTELLVRQSLLGGGDDSANSLRSNRKRGSAALKNDAASTVVENSTVEIKDIREWDILSGRGGKSNHHSGNKRFRQVVAEMKAKYKTTDTKTDKTALSKAIVEYVNGYGGRFLKKDAGQSDYRVMTKAEARKKTSQALRETKELKWKL
jgi:hypothetical protein